MILLLIICGLVGGLLGWRLRHRNLSFISPTVTILVCLLLFIMGIEIGSDEAALAQLKEMGWVSLVIAVFAMLGSIGVTWGFFYLSRKKRQQAKEKSHTAEREDYNADTL
ncbi:MAG: LysO family transporter [Porphyromonas sp.]|nr:lysine exporter LysO family protein [Bacteroidales bacterium]MDD7560087.1 LysO family transporter [Bacteroidales bacterium]MDY3100858.1 LysO family transporter [Porphyromonas sp.]